MSVTYRRIYQNDNGIWLLEFECDGQLFYFSLRTRIHSVALAKAEKYQRDLAGGRTLSTGVVSAGGALIPQKFR